MRAFLLALIKTLGTHLALPRPLLPPCPPSLPPSIPFPTPQIFLFIHHLFNFMTLILFIAFALALAVSEYLMASVLGVVILVNAVIGFTQAYR